MPTGLSLRSSLCRRPGTPTASLLPSPHYRPHLPPCNQYAGTGHMGNSRCTYRWRYLSRDSGPRGARMTVERSEARTDLIAANRILAHQGILDSLGHVSIRHPDDPTRFLLSRARSPGLVELSDLLEH